MSHAPEHPDDDGSRSERESWPPPSTPPADDGQPLTDAGSAPPAPPWSGAGAAEGNLNPASPAAAEGAPAPMSPTPPRPRTGAGIGAGVGIGCAGYVLGFLLMIASVSSALGIWGALWPFYVIAAFGITGMFFPRTRPIATGVLIVSAAAWLTILGPCVALLGGFS